MPMLKTTHKMAIARSMRAPIVLGRKLMGQNSQCVVSRNGLSWGLDLDEGIDLSIFIFGTFEPSTAKALRSLVPGGTTVLDIGANVGAHTLPLAKLVGETGRVVAFEPTDYAFSKLNHNIDLNPSLAKRIVAEQAFLTDVAAEIVPPSICSSWPLVTGEPVHEKHCGLAKTTNGARSIVLDEYCKIHNLDRVSVIKLDVDGHECKVLRGAKSLLSGQKPCIVMELAPYVLTEAGESLEELLSILDSANYKLYDEVTGKPLPFDQAKLTASIGDGAGINVIAR